ncbi:MAG: hypothetical protein QOD77_1718 [Thermoplasmata archaeon]|nr:hypothetical protein [Thermoplasmata archaeon]
MAKTPTAPSPSDVGEALHGALWGMRTHMGRALREAGITPAQSRVVWFLYEYGELPLGRLAELEGATAANLTGVMNRLEREGLARRRKDDADKRVSLVSLTAQGRARAKRARAAVEAGMAELFRGVPEDDLAVVLRVLRGVRQRAEDHPVGR